MKPTVHQKCVLGREGGSVKGQELTVEYLSLHSCGFSAVLGGQHNQGLVFRIFCNLKNIFDLRLVEICRELTLC